MQSNSENKTRERTCVGCRAKKSQSEMLRIAAFNSGEIKVNATEGRGAYICKDIKCLKSAMKKGSIGRTLKCQVNDDIYASLQTLIEE